MPPRCHAVQMSTASVVSTPGTARASPEPDACRPLNVFLMCRHFRAVQLQQGVARLVSISPRTFRQEGVSSWPAALPVPGRPCDAPRRLLFRNAVRQPCPRDDTQFKCQPPAWFRPRPGPRERAPSLMRAAPSTSFSHCRPNVLPGLHRAPDRFEKAPRKGPEVRSPGRMLCSSHSLQAASKPSRLHGVPGRR
jgi:hypothetical protein